MTGITCEFCRDLHLALLRSGFLKKICLKQGEVIVTLVTKLFTSSFLRRPFAQVTYQVTYVSILRIEDLSITN